jgi:hypothetical protein
MILVRQNISDCLDNKWPKALKPSGPVQRNLPPSFLFLHTNVCQALAAPIWVCAGRRGFGLVAQLVRARA